MRVNKNKKRRQLTSYAHTHARTMRADNKGSHHRSWRSALTHLHLEHIFYVFLFCRKSYRRLQKWREWCEFHRAWFPVGQRMFPANLSWMEQTEVTVMRKWEQVDSKIHQKKKYRQWSTFIPASLMNYSGFGELNQAHFLTWYIQSFTVFTHYLEWSWPFQLWLLLLFYHNAVF